MLSHIHVTRGAFIGENTAEICSRRHVRKIVLIERNVFLVNENVANSTNHVQA